MILDKSRVWLGLLVAGAMGSVSHQALAQAETTSGSIASDAADREDGAGEEQIVVTGSYITREGLDTPSPILMLELEDLARSGANTITDVVRNLTVNTGSQFNTDERTQGGTTGTANINLRGLGVGSTLVLQDGRRRPNGLAITNEGVTFVDINAMMPMVMVERIEVLKDGAASLYGSDAIAGVVNFITRKKFSGLEVSGGVRFADTFSATRDWEAAAIYGWQGDSAGLVVAASYLDRSLMTADELSFSTNQNFTTLGNPGAFQPAFRPFTGPNVPLENRPVIVLGPPSADPGCAANGGVVVSTPPTTLCGFNFDRFTTLTADEERFQLGLIGHVDLGAATSLTLRASHARSDTFRVTSPAFPLTALPFVPQNNPGFVAGSAPPSVLGTLNAIALPPTFVKGALFYGRAFPLGADAITNDFNYRTTWGSLSLEGAFSQAWKYNVAATYSRLSSYTRVPDVLKDRFIAALRGAGGPNNNQFYNPFASGIGAAPGSPQYNDPAVIADFRSAQIANSSGDMLVFDAVTSGPVYSAGNADVSLAVGAQYRKDTRKSDFNQEANDNRLFFLRGRPDTDFSQDVTALFAEAVWGFGDALEVQTAVRWEDHGGQIGSSVDPKVAVLWTPSDAISMRASYASAFRAPQFPQNELLSSITSLERLVDPRAPASSPFSRASFYPVVRVGNPALKAERSKSLNLGVTVRPSSDLTLRADYWSFDIDDLIVGQPAQALVTANNPANVIRLPGTNAIEYVTGTFVNAGGFQTNGLDFEVIYDHDFGSFGKVRADLTTTFILHYKFQDSPGAPFVDRVGRRNFGTIATSTPQLRSNFVLNWSKGAHSLTGIMRFIDSYQNDELLLRSPAQAPVTIYSWTTFDVQYQLSLDGLIGTGTSLTVGAVNVFDRDPPFAATENGLNYDSKVHDPRGRQIYVTLKQTF